VITIPLTQGKVALIDDCDAHLAAFKWCAKRDRDGRKWYAIRKAPRDGGPGRRMWLHREVLGVTDPKVEVDHKDGNGLDCRRHNLRAATTQQNQANRGVQANNTSGFKGVNWRKRDRKWRAQIRVSGRNRGLGHYATPEDAARAYDAAAREAFGEFAFLNFPIPPADTAAPTKKE
jgi:hypothetical protein